MMGTDIFMDRLRAFLSKPGASCAAQPMTTGSIFGGATTATSGVAATQGWGRMPSMEGRRWTTGKGRAAGTALCDGGVANMSCNGSCSEGRLCVRMGVAKQGMLKQEEGVHVVAVSRGFELR
jgi:hypothetical protein